MFASPYLTGLGISAGLIIAIGAQNAFVLRQGLKREFVFPVVVLCTLVDWTLIILGGAGFGSLVASTPILTAVAAWGGAAFLIAYGFLSFRSALKPKTLADESQPEQKVTNLRGVIAVTLAVSLLNPHVYLDTIVLIGGIAGQFLGSERLLFILGAGTSSFVWFFSLGFGARLLEPLFKNPLSWRILDLLIGLIMWSIAASLILGQLGA